MGAHRSLPTSLRMWRRPPAPRPPAGHSRGARRLTAGRRHGQDGLAVAQQLPALTMPALVMAGERDARYCAIAQRVAGGLPDAKLVIVPGRRPPAAARGTRGGRARAGGAPAAVAMLVDVTDHAADRYRQRVRGTMQRSRDRRASVGGVRRGPRGGGRARDVIVREPRAAEPALRVPAWMAACS